MLCTKLVFLLLVANVGLYWVDGLPTNGLVETMLESMVGGEACDQNEYFDTTGHACDNSCNPMSVDLCLKRTSGCFCEEGYKRNTANKCIESQDCGIDFPLTSQLYAKLQRKNLTPGEKKHMVGENDWSFYQNSYEEYLKVQQKYALSVKHKKNSVSDKL